MMSEGIVFYNFGSGSLARLTVALHTLRKVYNGSVAILSDGEVSNDLCKHLANDSRLGVQIVNGFFDVKSGRNHHYLSKCRVHELSPFDVSIYVDADVLFRQDLSDLFGLAEQHEFVVSQFCDWRSDAGGAITRRIRAWQPILPTDIDNAIKFGPAVNTGVFSFVKDSKFMRDWFKVARKGRRLFIPDESSCQVILYRYPHKVVEWWYNASCKYDTLTDPRVKVVHFHGRKHCREGLPFNGQQWVDAYNEVSSNNIGNIQEWGPGDDRKLRGHLARVNKSS